MIPGIDGRDGVTEIPTEEDFEVPSEEPIPHPQQIHPSQASYDLDPSDHDGAIPVGIHTEDFPYSPSYDTDLGEVDSTLWVCSPHVEPAVLQYGHMNDRLSSTFAMNLHSEVAEAYLMEKLSSWPDTYAAFNHLQATDLRLDGKFIGTRSSDECLVVVFNC